MKNQLPIVVGAESEMGRRPENQDHMTGFTSVFGAVYVVADGMGGHRGGAEASRMVTEGIRAHLLTASPDLPLAEAVSEAVRLTNQELFAKSSSGDPNFAGMGSTLSLVVISEEDGAARVLTAHVGDSRVYLERNGHLRLLTKDHTFVQRLLDSNAIDEETARTHPEANVLTRAMGQAPDVAADVSAPIPLANGDGILLCSDGLSGYVARTVIEDAVRNNPDPSRCAQALVTLALDSGSDDNVTVQFVRFGTNPDPVSPSSAKRKTQPESETLVDVPQSRVRNTFRSQLPGASPRHSRRMLFALLAGALLLVAAGVYKFRKSLLPTAPVPSPPAATQKKKKKRIPSRKPSFALTFP